MNPNDLERLSDRVAKLESSNRRLSGAVVVLLVVLACAAWMGQGSAQQPPAQQPAAQQPVPKAAPKTPPKPAQRRKPAPPATPKVIEAEQFVLKSGTGQVLATLGVTGGGPTLRLVGPNGTDRAVLGLDGSGSPNLVMKSADGSEPISIGYTATGVPRVALTAPDKSEAIVAIGSEGPGIGLLDRNGVVRLALDLKHDGPVLSLVDSNKVTRASLDIVEVPPPDLWGPNFKLFDPDGRARMALSVRPGFAAFNLQDSSGKPSVGLQVKNDNPALGLYGPNGKALFVKP